MKEDLRNLWMETKKPVECASPEAERIEACAGAWYWVDVMIIVVK